MSFDEVRLPEDIEQGAQGGPRFNTSVLELTSGHEKRNQNWSLARGVWDISYGIQNRAAFSLVLAFFYARRGKARGFRFKDWSDYSVDEALYFATGDASETDFQLTKTYQDDLGVTYVRDISKPVDGSIAIFADSVELSEGVDFDIDYTTGVVTFDSPPSDGALLDWTGEFDVPVRFDDDDLNVNLTNFDAGSLPSIVLVELRV